MSEFEVLLEAFNRVAGELVRTSIVQAGADGRDPSKVCWVARNVWKHPHDKDAPDVQFHAWQGEAWSSPQMGRLAGIWCGLNIEFKAAFQAVLEETDTDSHSFGCVARSLDGYRVAFGGKAGRKGPFPPVHVGLDAQKADYDLVFTQAKRMLTHGSAQLRPQLQVYKKICRWNDQANTEESLAEGLRVVWAELGDLFQLVTAGAGRLNG